MFFRTALRQRLLPALVWTCTLLPDGARAGGVPAEVFTVPVAPWTFPDQPNKGVASEYLRFLFDAAEVPATLGTLPYLRVVSGLRDGSNAAAILIPDAERDTFALRLCQVTSIHAGVLYKKSRYASLHLKQLDGLTVGVPRGTHALDKLKELPATRLYAVESIDQGLKMLRNDRLDATFVSNPGSDSVVRDAGLDLHDYGWLEVDALPVVVYVSRKAPLAQDAAALQRLRAVCAGRGRELMDKLMRQYR
jgi:polar amino acid transport system substrate-binding protein